MRLHYFVIGTLLTFISCYSPRSSNEKPVPYFQFDEITHIRILISDETFRNLKTAEHKTNDDEKLLTILTTPLTDNMEDCTLLQDIKNFNKIEQNVNKSYYPFLRDSLFIEKVCEDIAAGSCDPCFRDILIFKKQGEVTGLAKFFFGCSMYEFCGAKGNDDCFGAFGEMRKLSKLLIENRDE